MEKTVKHILLTVFMLLPLGMYADGNAFKFTTAGGQTYTFLYSEEPEITVEGTKLTVTSNDAKYGTLTFTFDDLCEIIPGDETAVETISAAPAIERHGSTFTITSAGGPARIYSMSGQLVGTVQHDNDGNVSVSLSDLPSATYVISCGRLSMKVRK